MSYGDYGLRPRPCCKWAYRSGPTGQMERICIGFCNGQKKKKKKKKKKKRIAAAQTASAFGAARDGYGALVMPEHRGLIALGMLVAGATIGHVVGTRFGRTDPATYALMGAMLGGAYGLRSYMAADIYRQKLEG